MSGPQASNHDLKPFVGLSVSADLCEDVVTMSNLTFLRGDLFAASVDCRINPVNCVGVMGKGLALQFKLRYPAMFANYQEACRAGQLRPGHLHIWPAPDGTRIINFP